MSLPSNHPDKQFNSQQNKQAPTMTPKIKGKLTGTNSFSIAKDDPYEVKRSHSKVTDTVMFKQSLLNEDIAISRDLRELESGKLEDQAVSSDASLEEILKELPANKIQALNKFITKKVKEEIGNIMTSKAMHR